MQKISFRKVYSIIIFLMIWVYFSLNAKYLNFPASHLMRWIFPACLIILMVLQNGKKIAKPPFIFWIFSIAVLPSIILSDYSATGIVKYFSWIFILYGSYIFFIGLKNTDYLKRYLRILFVVLVIYQILNFFFVVSGVNYDSGRALGITTNANTLGVYANLAYWATFYEMRHTKIRSRKILWMILTITTVVTSIVSGSRTAFVVLMLNILISIIILFRKSPFFVVYILVAVLVSYLVLSGTFNNVLNITALDRLLKEGGTSRDNLWIPAIDLWKQHEVFGVGYTVSGIYNPVETGMAFHNSYISFLTECGLWGCLILGSGMIIFLKKIVLTLNRKNSDGEFLIAVIMGLNIMIAAWSESFMFAVGSTEGFTFWFLVAWIAAYMKLLHR